MRRRTMMDVVDASQMINEEILEFVMTHRQVVYTSPDGQVSRLEILSVEEKPGKFRRVLPTLPLPLAVFLAALNTLLPGFGESVSAARR